MNVLLDFRPDILDDDSTLTGELRLEPSLRMLLENYYKKHFSEEKAEELTKRYLKALEEA
jgi:hypothetical protein